MSKKDWFLAGLDKIGNTVDKKLDDAVTTARNKPRAAETQTEGRENDVPQQRPTRNETSMDWMEPDWEELDHKADMIVARYALVSSAWNVLPPPLDVMGVTATFAKMATELAGVYQVIVSSKRARQMGWAIATTTASVLGVAYAGSRVMKLFPAGWLVSLLVQAPIVGAVAWAAGDTLKSYFKQTRQGIEPSIKSLQDSFGQTLHLKLKSAKVKPEDAALTPEVPAATNGASAAPPAAVPDSLEKIASLHELLRSGALTQAEYEAAKTDLLKKI